MSIKTTYLQMLAHARQDVSAPRPDLSILHARRPTVSYYRFLYDAVGGRWNWTSRKRLADEQLAAILQDPLVEIHVLHAAGTPAGFAELDRRQPGDIELVQFGLMPEFIGQGLGRYFLLWTIDRAWSYNPRRLWLHTCTNDHPAALPNYLRRGFVVFKEEIKEST